ncbi:MAG: hypothetical protein LIO94_08940, partial [Clostridiales bacterium]|nr:hypothetical protein [Clostridiales bacterium]
CGAGYGDAIEENRPSQRFLKQAEKMLESYRSLLKRKADLEYEMEHTQGYSHDDILYLLSCGSHGDNTERVQTSNISNPTERAVLDAGKLAARLNGEIRRQFQVPYRKVCRQVGLVNIALGLMDEKTRSVAEQLYVDGKKLKDVVDLHGQKMSVYKAKAERTKAIDILADVLVDDMEIRNDAPVREELV